MTKRTDQRLTQLVAYASLGVVASAPLALLLTAGPFYRERSVALFVLASIATLGWVPLIVVLARWPRWRPYRAGRCVRCGYDVRQTLREGRTACPECGGRISVDP